VWLVILSDWYPVAKLDLNDRIFFESEAWDLGWIERVEDFLNYVHVKLNAEADEHSKPSFGAEEFQ
jgi:hypothetical protein